MKHSDLYFSGISYPLRCSSKIVLQRKGRIMNFLFAVCHTGQGRALQSVTDRLISEGGHKVVVLLERGQSAWVAYEYSQALAFQGCDVFNLSCSTAGEADSRTLLGKLIGGRGIHRVLSMISPTPVGVPTVETLALQVGRIAQIPTFGFVEVPCGHKAPVWNGLFTQFDKSFVAQRTPDLADHLKYIEVGFDVSSVDRERALATKQALGIAADAPWIWYYGGPYAKAGSILRNLIGFVDEYDGFIPIVFTRHIRERLDPKAKHEYCEAVLQASRLGIVTSENSADHDASETTSVQRAKDEILRYSDLLNACSANGLLVTGHGTDGMMKAPRMGIRSILCVGNKLNPDILSEKGCEILPLPPGCPIQVTDYEGLDRALKRLFENGESSYRELCAEHYFEQQQTPAEIIVEHLLA